MENLLYSLDEQMSLSVPDWGRAALDSHMITSDMVVSVNIGRVDEFIAARQAALERQLGIFLRQRCEWDFEDTPPLDSLVLDDEDEAEELSDDESAGLR